MHTSAKERLTSAAIWRISMSNGFMSVNHFYVSPDSDKSGKQSRYPDGDPDSHRNLIIYSLAHCQPSLKISRKSVGSFCAKLLTDKQGRKHILLAKVITTNRPIHNFHVRAVVCIRCIQQNSSSTVLFFAKQLHKYTYTDTNKMRLMHAIWKHDKRIRKSFINSNQLLSLLSHVI